MKQHFLILIVVFPFLCFSQNLRVSEKGNVKVVYPISDIQEITFANVKCITNDVNNIVIKTFNQLKNYPNPFSNVTTIELTLNKPGNTVIDIYNAQGILINELLNSNLASGEHKINWDGKTNSGNRVMNGLYFYQVKVNNEIYSNKMFLIK
jgi:hypothetical protein